MTKFSKIVVSLIIAILASGPIIFESSARGASDKPTYRLVLTSKVQWVPLNPARGEEGPRAGTLWGLWGDRTSTDPSGFLVRFVQGFSSPPHIHNVTYRGVVIKGLVHNDDPKAQEMWMPAGSFWTQPKGEVHITAAKSKTNLAYIEIDQGPYLVRPPSQAFDSGERPINMDKSNIVWVDQPEKRGAKIAFLWGSPREGLLNGSFVKLPEGFSGKIQSLGEALNAVVIKGQPSYQTPETSEPQVLQPGSYFGSRGKTATHLISCKLQDECILYLRMKGRFKLTRQ